MITYLVPFENIHRFSKKIDEIGYRGIYWEDKSKYVIEIPMISNKGASMGVCFRCEIGKKQVEEIVREKAPYLPKMSRKRILQAFEVEYLQSYHKVLGRFGETLEVDFLEELPEPKV